MGPKTSDPNVGYLPMVCFGYRDGYTGRAAQWELGRWRL